MLILIVPLVNLNLYNFHVMLIKVSISCISLCHKTDFIQKTNLYINVFVITFQIVLLVNHSKRYKSPSKHLLEFWQRTSTTMIS